MSSLHEIRSRPQCVLCSFAAIIITGSLSPEGQQDRDIVCFLSWRCYDSTGRLTSENNPHSRRLVVWTSQKQPYSDALTKNFFLGLLAEDALEIDLELGLRPKDAPESDLQLCLLAEDAAESDLQGRLIHWEQAPFETIKSWLARCLKNHGAECEKPALKTWGPAWAVPDFRLVDVEEACLVKMPKECQYITLSYVWGTIPSFMTTKANMKQLESPGILRTLAHQLPRTVRDAIDLVGMIGYRFLWIDQLCIVQDDRANVQVNIWNMDRIYGQSMLLIIAADGEHADSGLSRTGPLTGVHQQTILRIEPTLRLVTINQSRTLLNESTYQRRGWTYQEDFFAKRKLIFVGNRVFFECHKARWQEDIALDDEIRESKRNRPSNTWHHGSIYPSYRESVHDFTSRQLTFPVDVMDAFAGVSNYWAESFGATMKYGLPNSVFDWAILWHACGQPLKQRQGEGCTFPTWSWAGWMGPVEMEKRPISGQDWLTHHTWIIWYQWSPSLTALLWDVNHERKEKIRSGDASVGYRISNTIDPFGRNKNRFLIDGKSQADASFAEIQGLDDPRLLDSLRSRSGQILLFWTVSAKFDLEYHKEITGRSWAILDRRGVAAGYIFPDQGSEAMQADVLNGPNAFELIALSDDGNVFWDTHKYEQAYGESGVQEHRQAEHEGLTVIDTGPDIKDPGSWNLYYVMLITWRGPIAERRCIGKIYKSAMKYALGPGPVWKRILLR